jgi:hypothetical protein
MAYNRLWVLVRHKSLENACLFHAGGGFV